MASSALTTLVRGERGATMIEVTMMLLATVTLIGAVAPVATSVLRSGERARTAITMNSIQLQINQFLGDLAYNKFTIDGTKTGTQVRLLVSDGDAPKERAGAGSALWQPAVDNASGLVDFLERHLGTNKPRDNTANAYPSSFPPIRFWRGAYLTAPVDSDPWGNRFAVNVQYLGPSLNDVVVLSAGINEIIETDFTGNPLVVGGDDVLVVVEP